MDDPELLSHRSAVALLQVRIEELLERLESGDSAAAFERIKSTWTAVEGAKTSDELQAALRAHGQAIKARSQVDEAWTELCDALHSKAGLAAREHARLIDLGQMMPAEQVLALVAALEMATKETIEAVRRRIAPFLTELENGRPDEVRLLSIATSIRESLKTIEGELARRLAALMNVQPPRGAGE